VIGTVDDMHAFKKGFLIPRGWGEELEASTLS